MPLEVCFAYPWATYGGVERVFLNRALAFREAGIDVHVDVYYGADGGGLEAFRKTIEALGLAPMMRIVEELDPSRYSVVLVIDSPQIMPQPLPDTTKWIVECHTPYSENRDYLDQVPPGVSAIVAPSSTFARTLALERPHLEGRIKVVGNCLSPIGAGQPPQLPGWHRTPLLFFGRLDDLKNPQGFLDLVAHLDRVDQDCFFGVAVGPQVEGYGFETRANAAGLHGNVIRLPPVPFMQTQGFLEAWRNANGIMVSPSRGESFGLAAAEAIMAGVPVLLSDLPEHRDLVQDDERHLYAPHDTGSGADKVAAIVADYEAASCRMRGYAKRFDTSAFIADWTDLMQALGLASAPAVGAHA